MSSTARSSSSCPVTRRMCSSEGFDERNVMPSIVMLGLERLQVHALGPAKEHLFVLPEQRSPPLSGSAA